MSKFADSSAMGDQEEAHEVVIDGLWDFYSKTMLPVEEATRFDIFQTSAITKGEIHSPPLVLLVGPYSAGKTSFIRYLVGRDFPGQRIGPEPTTDKFVAVLHGEEDRIVPGNALTVAPMSPFGGLKYFGNGFLTRFEGSVMNNDILKRITLIDTPGVLSGSKQRTGRTYDFDGVVNWFAERADMIILLIDPFKLDISDEMASAIRVLQSNADKVKVALNKSDAVSQQQLMRVYGALMWSLGKVMGTPEVCRVYMGSFWEHPPSNEETANLLRQEMEDMMHDLWILPRMGAVRKVNELVKRSRKLRVQACILDYLREEMPTFMGLEKKKQALLADMPGVFRAVCRKYNLPPGDFPDIAKFTQIASEMDFKTFPRLNGARLKGGKLMKALEDGIGETIPKLLEHIPTISGTAGSTLPTATVEATEAVGAEESVLRMAKRASAPGDIPVDAEHEKEDDGDKGEDKGDAGAEDQEAAAADSKNPFGQRRQSNPFA
uniref:Dynamin-type G domain-containing protein n=1 Tax=Pinguiococcus pyrenoidosus TaxID=172671 RepID=A0A7R9UDB7_9STRA|mmetsp:Transcript_6386/g.24790  ORF Transcript_6386/g.24790 Transcript_6386/m.24790 type:complete len:491 (+) Transcript_6386:115-1587(+)